MAHALGRHVLIELHDCQQHLNDVTAIETHMIAAAHAAGATVINTTFHHFAPMGVSGVVVIQESHLAIHTWPEQRFAAIDIFTCGRNIDPWRAVSYLKRAFQAQRGDAREIPRGEVPNTPTAPYPSASQSHPIQHNLWFTERSDNLALSLRHTGVAFQTQSPYQKIEVLNTVGYGRMLVLDGQIMCTEKDECVYHEMLVHVPILLHPAPQKILVIGGGDGGAVRELIRHQHIQHIDLVEIDERVVQTARDYLPTLSNQLDNKRVHIHIQDGTQFIKTAQEHTYDIILIDIPGEETLQSQKFYQAIYRALKEDGIMVAQIAPPVFFNPNFPKTIQAQQHVFQTVHPYFAFIPTYATGMLSFSLASKNHIQPNPIFDEQKAQQFTAAHPLQYYTTDIHKASFAIPPFVQTLLTSGEPS